MKTKTIVFVGYAIIKFICYMTVLLSIVLLFASVLNTSMLITVPISIAYFIGQFSVFLDRKIKSKLDAIKE